MISSETTEKQKELCFEKKIKVRMIPTEVYSRIVGYYRPLQNWNKGKAEEFSQRLMLNPHTLS
jgi:anaerobic ribonucleoside-triphosphate reductase